MKRIICLFLAVMLLMPSAMLATAYEDNAADSIYIQTVDCPPDVINYVTENAARLIMSMDEENTLNLDDVHVGQPFSYGYDASGLFTFPVFEGEKVVYTLRVAYSQDGQLNGTMSTFLVDELNGYMGLTSYDSPLLFAIEDNALYAVVGDESTQICEFEGHDAPTMISLADETEPAPMLTCDISTPLDFELSWLQSRASSRYIFLSITEVQPSNNHWCVAYSTAAVLRTLEAAAVSARDIMVCYYGINVGASQNLPNDLAAEYCRNYIGLMSTTFTRAGLSNDELVSQIDYIGPVVLSMTNQTDGGRSAHAIVLRGYSKGNSTWSIWDPVNKKKQYETFSWDSDYVSATGNVFYYNGGTIYDFC